MITYLHVVVALPLFVQVAATGDGALNLQLGTVDSIEVLVQPESAHRRIVHLRDWHIVDSEAFAADLRNENPEITAKDIAAAYRVHLDTVERVQQEEKEYLRFLIKEHGLTAVYLEGVTAENSAAFKVLARATAEAKEGYDELAKLAERAPIDSKPRQDYERGIAEIRRDFIRIGAVGQLFAAGELKDVRPLEDGTIHAKSKPVGEDGKVVIDRAVSQERHDAIAKIVAKSDEAISVIVLGGGHDLSDSVKRHIPGAEYVRVTLKSFPGD